VTHVLKLFDLTGKVALVTGGGRGLGFFAAEALAEAGADVVICGRNVAQLESAAEQLNETTGQKCLAIACDVTDEGQVLAMVETIKERFGRCDILLNNAGVADMKPTEHVSLKEWQEMMAINLDGAFLCSREIGKLMIEQKSGSIINFSSENGQVGFSTGMAAYATSKIGVIGLTRSLAVEWGEHNIRVNALLPGNMEEGMMEAMKDKNSPMYQTAAAPLLKLIPMTSFGSADDIKGAVAFLASDAGRYVSGAKLILDGGFTINSGL
jgi:gluconate 5-dehydrogenase